MARKQLQIKGTERTDLPPHVIEAGEEWLDARKEARRAREKMQEKYFGALAVMQASKLKLAKLVDDETGEVITLRVTNDPKLVAEKDGEIESEVGEGLPEHAGATTEGGVPAGLIAQAEKAQLDAGVTVDAEGDVQAPDVAAPKKKTARKRGK